MFTGLVQDIGKVVSLERKGQEDWRVRISTSLDMRRYDIGASMACSGCCLTIVEKGPDWFGVDVSSESLSKTTIKDWAEGTWVNLEPSLRLGDELGGHFVSGHVDGRAHIRTIEPSGGSHIFSIEAPQDLTRLLAPKGSVTLEGVSLTVNAVEGTLFTVNIIPHTAEKTTLGQKRAGDRLNIEIDMLARYVAAILGRYNQEEPA